MRSSSYSKLAALLGFAACLSVDPSTVHSQEAVADSATVAAVVHGFHAALQTGDSARVLRLLADDAVVLESGGQETRGEYRAHHLNADIQFSQAVTTSQRDLRVVVRGEVAWVSSVSEVSGTYRGRSVNSVGAELIVLTREADGWRIRAIHWSSRSRRGDE